MIRLSFLSDRVPMTNSLSSVSEAAEFYSGCKESSPSVLTGSVDVTELHIPRIRMIARGSSMNRCRESLKRDLQE